MLLAQKRRSIMAAISSAASSQMAGSNAVNGGSIMARRAPDPSFDLEEPWVRRIGRALLALSEVFTLNPSQWRRLSFFQCDESTSNHNSFLAAEEPLETLLRFHARIGEFAILQPRAFRRKPRLIPNTYLTDTLLFDRPRGIIVD
jgi:hypothetical protein